MLTPEIYFSVFDYRLGPISIYATTSNEDLANNIALKSQLTMALYENYSIGEIDAILSFPESHKVAYIFAFKIEALLDENKKVTSYATLSYVLDYEQQVDLYSVAPLLKEQAKSIANILRSEYTYVHVDLNTKQPTLSTRFSTIIQKFGDSEILQQYLDTIKNSSYNPKNNSSVIFLIETFPKNLDILLYGLISGSTILVIGHEVIIPVVMECIQLLIPFKLLKYHPFTRTYINTQDYDMIGIDEGISKEYTKEKVVIVNITKREISGQNSSKYFQLLIKKIKETKMSEEQAKEIIHKEMENILIKANEIIELYNTTKFSQEFFTTMTKAMDKDILQLALKVVSQYNPTIMSKFGIEEKMAAYFSNF